MKRKLRNCIYTAKFNASLCISACAMCLVIGDVNSRKDNNSPCRSMECHAYWLVCWTAGREVRGSNPARTQEVGSRLQLHLSPWQFEPVTAVRESPAYAP